MLIRFTVFILTFALLLWGIFRESPPPDLSAYMNNDDKIIHLFSFYVFGLTAFFAFSHKKLIWVIVFLLTMALGLEYLQGVLQTSRTFSVFDAIANVFGVILSWMTFRSLHKILNNEQNN